MSARTLQWTALGLAAIVAAAAPGCSSGSDTDSPRPPSSSSSAGGGGGEGGAGGDGGAGGGGGAAADNGHPATETVSAGDVSKSKSYTMVFTFGQPAQNQGKTTSPGYQMQGGLIGANGSTP